MRLKALISTTPFTEELQSKENVRAEKADVKILKNGLARQARGVTVIAGVTASLLSEAVRSLSISIT